MRTVLTAIACLFLADSCFAISRDNDRFWETFWKRAVVEAERKDRLILAYFCGSDWCEWCKKLEKDVLDTEMFMEFAKANLVLLKVDFPSDPKKIGQVTKQQNDDLKRKYNVQSTPTLLFLNHHGQVLARADYDTAKLREAEKTGRPMEWLKFCREIVEKRPSPESLTPLQGLGAGLAHAKKNDLPLLLILQKEQAKPVEEKIERLLSAPDFIRFANTCLSVARVTWPGDEDLSPAAVAFTEFAAKHQLPPATLQLVLYDPVKDAVAYRAGTFEPGNIEPVLISLNKSLPTIPYEPGAWITNYRKGLAIANQSRRMVILYFTSSDASEYCTLMDNEVLGTPQFKQFAQQHFVLVKLDYPKQSPLADDLKKQNQELADLYQIRGFPTVIVLNNKGQQAATAKYNPGGPEPFLKQMTQVRQRDMERFNKPSEWDR